MQEKNEGGHTASLIFDFPLSAPQKLDTIAWIAVHVFFQ
jgi:hypothetical protein